MEFEKIYFYLYTNILPVHIFFPGFGGEASLPPYLKKINFFLDLPKKNKFLLIFDNWNNWLITTKNKFAYIISVFDTYYIYKKLQIFNL